MEFSPLYLHGIKQAMRAMWMAGDFGMIAKGVAHDAEEFVRRLEITPGMRVLDVACGTGNVAIPLARRGALVTGVDIAPNLLVQARERAGKEGLDITFDEGDAEELPYADSTFDAVVTMFGAMFAPRPELVVMELARVLKPGGLLAMANWTPGGFAGQMFQVTGRHVPPPMGLAPPVHWGHPKIVRDRLAGTFDRVELNRVPLIFDFPASPAEVVTFFRAHFGPTQMAFAQLDERGQARLAAELEQLWTEGNTADDPTQRTCVANEYLQVTARLR